MIGFVWWRFRVCLLCWWHLRHWPANDISIAHWADSYRNDWSPREAFEEMFRND